ncbi:MAG: sigma-54-dependent Fis family transcriptional regulator [Candidatus Eisenbacteria bacterium]|nr:sigma-54-dependent Fis family transcriptional regulator [Candidatus Eisenbacteria bacterium]MCC7141627.1 sigma-54-dependent Fis family transcriptional regulator [Candidatus Eisenbacteria bacterium]
MRGRILVVEDDREFGALLETGLRAAGFDVRWTDEAEPAREAALRESFDAVVTDIHLRGASGLDLCAELNRARPELPILIVTGFGNMESAIAAIRAGAYDFITKPLELEVLVGAVDRAVQHHSLGVEVRRLRAGAPVTGDWGGMIGSSPVMRRMFEQLERVADTEAPILITGESGTGKELVARAVHAHSRRAPGAFVPLNCAAMPEALLESELFGHARGAFTDAKAERTGLFVQASGGTLFLDEVGEFAMTLQPKLLRALQERRVRPVGGTAEVPFDARLISATNRDLEFEAETGRFREDLYFRLNVIRIEVPPLRERGDDILLIAQRMIDQIAARDGRSVRGLGVAAAERLIEYPWPGNVRELQNCIERAVALADHDLLLVEDLPERIRRSSAHLKPASPTAVGGPGSPMLSMEEVERRHILTVLNEVGGNKSLAARILGLDRRTLYRKLETYGH